MKLSQRLINKRYITNKGQRDVSAEIGVSITTYNFLEQGEYRYKKLEPKTVGKIAKYLEITPQEVVESFKEDLISKLNK